MLKYSSEMLPAGFKYPPAYLDVVKKTQDFSPWVFIDTDSEVGKLLLDLGMADGKQLVPFASLENGDGDAACFDGNDCSGNPQVRMLILDGSDRHYSFKDFDEWLKQALR